MKRWPTLQCGPGIQYSVDLRILTYAEPVPLKYGKLATNYPCSRVGGRVTWLTHPITPLSLRQTATVTHVTVACVPATVNGVGIHYNN